MLRSVPAPEPGSRGGRPNFQHLGPNARSCRLSSEVSFFAGREWSIRFADVPVRGLEELGVLIFLDGDRITSFSDLVEAEEL